MGHHKHDHHGHGHSHHQAHAPEEVPRLLQALGLTALLMIIELMGGWLSGSLALFADAGHMLMDTQAHLIVLGTAWLKRSQGKRFPAGTGGVETVASFLICLLLLVLVGSIVFEALERWREPRAIITRTVLVIALAGFAVNALVLSRIHPLNHGALHIRALTLHVIGDLAGSVVVILSATAMTFWQWWRADVVASLILSFLITISASLLIRDALLILAGYVSEPFMEQIKTILHKDKCVKSHHSLKVRPLSGQQFGLSVHLVVSCAGSDARDSLRHKLEEELESLGFVHDEIAIQFESHDTAPVPPHDHFH